MRMTSLSPLAFFLIVFLCVFAPIASAKSAEHADGEAVCQPDDCGQAASLIEIKGVENGETYFSPVTPKVVVPENLTVEEVTLNGDPHDEKEITDQGLHELSVIVTDEEGRRSELGIRFIVLDPDERAPAYTVEMVSKHMARVARSPYVKPTASADERFIVGQSKGWPKDPKIPQHNLYAFQITNFEVEGPKLRIILLSGNHNLEQTGSWALQGTLDFLISDDPRAAELRRQAVFFVYPMVNPDGRYTLSGRGNPELLAEDARDHNRVWNTSGRFSTIDIFTEAMRTDTGGSADYLLDFHSAGSTFFYTGPELTTSPFAYAVTGREPGIRPRSSEGHPGMIRIWSMREDALNVPTAYTPELAGSETAERSLEIGRAYAMAFYDLISGDAALATIAETLDLEVLDAAFVQSYRDRLVPSKDRLELVLSDDEATLHDVREAVYELYASVNEYKKARALSSSADELIASAARLEQRELQFGIPYKEALPPLRKRLSQFLSDNQARVDQVEKVTDELVNAIAEFGDAEVAEISIALADELLEQRQDGFGRLYQNKVEIRRNHLVKMLAEREATIEEVRDATERLDREGGEYRKIEMAKPSPPVQAVELTTTPADVVLCSKDDWEEGLLVNVKTDGGDLILAESPALSFDGNGAFVETGFYPGEAMLGDRFTWEFWKYYRTFANDAGSSGSSEASPRFYTQLTSSSGRLRTAIGDSYWNSTTVESENEWYHIAFVYDGGEVRTYLNGDLRDVRSGVNFSGESSGPFTMGRGFDDGRWLDGYTREHRIWNTARSQREIRQTMYNKLDGDEKGLAGYWRLDEGDGEVAYDGSENANHGEIRGAQWRLRAQPGYRLSQPVSFAGISMVHGSAIEWEFSANADDAEQFVRVFTGLTDSSNVLPDEWQPAANGEPVPSLENGQDLPGKYLWIKQKILPADSDVPTRLHRLTLRLKDDG